MKEERYLQIFLTQFELGPNIKKIILNKLKEKYLYREFDGKIITNIEINNFINLPLSNNLELNIPAKVTDKIYKPGDIIDGEIFSYEKDNRAFVLSYDTIREILNVDFNKIKNKNNVYVKLTYIKSTNGCIYFFNSREYYLFVSIYIY